MKDKIGPLFKDEQMKKEFWGLTAKAKYLLCKLNYVSLKRFNTPITVTCIWYDGGSGIHSQWRAFDIRTEGYYTKKQIDWLIEHFNVNFPYDINRVELNTLVYHKVNDKKIKDYELVDFVPQFHIHAQVYIR